MANTPVFLPGEVHGQRSLADYSPRGCQESVKIGRTRVLIPGSPEEQLGFGLGVQTEVGEWWIAIYPELENQLEAELESCFCFLKLDFESYKTNVYL